MKIDNEFTVGVPVDRAWEVLTDLEGIAPCMPGAQLTGVDGDVYTGKIKIKVGPVISQYAGTAEIVEKDAAARRAVIRAKGKDSRGAGNASALINATLRAEGDTTVVTVVTDLNITGKIAQFGSGMIKEVSVKLLSQFVQNLEAQLHAQAPEPAATPAPEPTPIPAPAPEPEPLAASAPAAVRETPVSSPARTHVPAPTPAPAPEEKDDDVAPLDLMGIAGASVYKRFLPVVAGAVVVIAVVVYLLVR
ncbi:SRPBCC family protein [Streptomyces sp. NPDC088124]|uniref:SRPBCC family protein n=1 Tax=Streptomyces sp. NPDC088124 TaxID=3154654 RepID=UPI00341C081B